MRRGVDGGGSVAGDRRPGSGRAGLDRVTGRKFSRSREGYSVSERKRIGCAQLIVLGNVVRKLRTTAPGGTPLAPYQHSAVGVQKPGCRGERVCLDPGDGGTTYLRFAHIERGWKDFKVDIHKVPTGTAPGVRGSVDRWVNDTRGSPSDGGHLADILVCPLDPHCCGVRKSLLFRIARQARTSQDRESA
jgi:hypothetical protein